MLVVNRAASVEWPAGLGAPEQRHPPQTRGVCAFCFLLDSTEPLRASGNPHLIACAGYRGVDMPGRMTNDSPADAKASLIAGYHAQLTASIALYEIQDTIHYYCRSCFIDCAHATAPGLSRA